MQKNRFFDSSCARISTQFLLSVFDSEFLAFWIISIRISTWHIKVLYEGKKTKWHSVYDGNGCYVDGVVAGRLVMVSWMSACIRLPHLSVRFFSIFFRFFGVLLFNTIANKSRRVQSILFIPKLKSSHFMPLANVIVEVFSFFFFIFYSLNLPFIFIRNGCVQYIHIYIFFRSNKGDAELLSFDRLIVLICGTVLPCHYCCHLWYSGISIFTFPFITVTSNCERTVQHGAPSFKWIHFRASICVVASDCLEFIWHFMYWVIQQCACNANFFE